MASFYKLQIKSDLTQKKKIEKILGPSNVDENLGWGLIIDEESELFESSLIYFSDLIRDNLIELKNINITVDKITFWYFYEYEHQCNMEFWPNITRAVGELGVVLCISCWEK